MVARSERNISVSDEYTVLLDESLRENRILREQLSERDERNSSKIAELTRKVDSLCQLMTEKEAENNTMKKKKKGARKVHVPTRCRVSE